MMAAMEGTKINGGRKRSLEILFRLARTGVDRERETCRFAVGMSGVGRPRTSRFVVVLLLRSWQTELPLRLPAYLKLSIYLTSDSFAACTRALEKLSTFLSTIKAVTASFRAC